MRNDLFLKILPVLAVLLAGCSTPPPPASPEPAPEPEVAATAPVAVPEIEPVSTLPMEMQKLTDEFARAGGLAVLGTAESKSLDLALNMAKVNGRLQLAQVLNDRIETMAKAFSEESGIPYDSLLLGGFNDAVRVITRQVIAGSVAKELKYETKENTTTAYAVMVLDPKIVADQLAKEADLYPRLQASQALDTLNQQTKTYEAFTAARKASL